MQAEAEKALAALPKAERDWVLSLPQNEAMLVIRLLVAFPDSQFVTDA